MAHRQVTKKETKKKDEKSDTLGNRAFANSYFPCKLRQKHKYEDDLKGCSICQKQIEQPKLFDEPKIKNIHLFT